MDKRKGTPELRKAGKKIRPADIFPGALLAGELAVLLDTVSVLLGKALSVPKFALLLAVLFGLALWMAPGLRKLLTILLTAAAGLLLGCVLCWQDVSRNAAYTAVDEGKAQLYSGRRVMLLVPHQDDDINVLGGVMEEYVKYGSEVYVVFSTNGDYYDQAAVRIREAVRALGSIGIPEDHVIFLGYGDQWQKDGPHLYNAKPGQTLPSFVGYRETYGTEEHPSWQVGKAYTVDNFLTDVEDVILEYRPDVLYCVDYDYNIDHQALTLSFEKVMGKILKETDGYAPLVFKGFAYNTAWEAEADFYGENLLSAQNVFSEPYFQQPEIYRWEERVRLPVNGESLSRSVISAAQNKTLSLYESQGANMYGPRVINGDKVFWQRQTDSLCLTAQIQTSSGEGSLLNDFMIMESRNLTETGDTPWEGAWIPAVEDTEKTVRVRFPEPVDVADIVLYDHLDPEKNVLDAVISFEDGTSVKTGPLDPAGAATRIPVEKSGISGFAITLTQLQGEAGLTEIEAFSGREDSLPPYLKLMDEDGNFAYDYWIRSSGSQSFRLYTAGSAPDTREVYVLTCEGEGCSAAWEDDGIRVSCPAGKACVVTVAAKDGSISDSVYIQNPGSLERSWTRFWLRAEETVMKLCESKRLHERVFLCRMAQKLPEIFGIHG